MVDVTWQHTFQSRIGRNSADFARSPWERFYDRTLPEIARLAVEASSGSHQRYLEIYALMQRRDRDMARAFDDPRRSRALQQLSAMHALGLLEVEELAAFTDETREAVEFLSTLTATFFFGPIARPLILGAILP